LSAVKKISLLIIVSRHFLSAENYFQKLVRRKLSAEKKVADCCQTLMNKGLCLIADNVHALAMAGQFITFCWNVCTVNGQKAEIIILLLNREFSAWLTPNNEQKADYLNQEGF
jgi:hypothetical protein